MSELLQANEITLERIEEFLKSAFIPYTKDSDGDLCITDDALKIFIRIVTDGKLLAIYCILGLEEGGSMEKKLAWVNQLNRDLPLVTFKIMRPDILQCDYHIHFEGGLSPAQLISTIRMFGKVCLVAASKDPDDILGRS